MIAGFFASCFLSAYCLANAVRAGDRGQAKAVVNYLICCFASLFLAVVVFGYTLLGP